MMRCGKNLRTWPLLGERERERNGRYGEKKIYPASTKLFQAVTIID